MRICERGMIVSEAVADARPDLVRRGMNRLGVSLGWMTLYAARLKVPLARRNT